MGGSHNSKEKRKAVTNAPHHHQGASAVKWQRLKEADRLETQRSHVGRPSLMPARSDNQTQAPWMKCPSICLVACQGSDTLWPRATLGSAFNMGPKDTKRLRTAAGCFLVTYRHLPLAKGHSRHRQACKIFFFSFSHPSSTLGSYRGLLTRMDLGDTACGGSKPQTIPGRFIDPVKLAVLLMSIFGEETYNVSISHNTYQIQAPRWLSEVNSTQPWNLPVKETRLLTYRVRWISRNARRPTRSGSAVEDLSISACFNGPAAASRMCAPTGTWTSR